MATKDGELESMMLCGFCGSRLAEHTPSQRLYCEDELAAALPHVYTVDVYLHAHEVRPCLICGKRPK